MLIASYDERTSKLHVLVTAEMVPHLVEAGDSVVREIVKGFADGLNLPALDKKRVERRVLSLVRMAIKEQRRVEI